MTTEDIKINFPDCYPGKEYIRFVDWTNRQPILNIERDKKTNRCEWMFNVEEAPFPAKALRINYKPILPNTSNFDYFYVTIENKNCIKIILCGTTLGPNVHCKTNKLILSCSNANPIRRIIQIENTGTMEANYQFDIDNESSDLTITPSCGTIMTNEIIDILLTYYPKRPAIVFRQIFCLVHYQEPFLIKLRANYNKLSAYKEVDDFVNIQEPLPKYANSYEGYLQDVATKLFQQSRPLLTLDRKYIDFGLWDNNKAIKSINTQTFSITNHLMVKVLVTWLFDDRVKFSIEPPKAEVANGCCVQFQAKFEPCLLDQLYSANIVATINWGTNYDFVVPFPLSIDLIGHTFSGMRTGWDPFYRLSKYIILPGTLPNTPSYVTYKMENTGQFLLMFKLDPPLATKVTFKPMQGIIEGNSFQLFNIRLFPGLKADTYYSEKWNLQINICHKIEIEISTTAELPYLIISNNEVVKFPPSNLDTVTGKYVPVKNETRLTIGFKLIINEPESPFSSEKENHVIGPNELTQILLYYRPRSYGKVTSHIYFEIECKNPKIPIKYSSTITKVEGICSKVRLSANPDHLYLKETLMNCWSYASFTVENVSDCQANVVMESKPRTWDDEGVVAEIEPKSFIVAAQSKIHVRIGVRPSALGYKYMKVVYFLCTDERLQADIHKVPQTLLTYDIYCSVPILRVIDIRLSRNQQIYAKYFMWKRLQINKLNESLGDRFELRVEDEEMPVYMKLPVGTLGSSPVKVDILIKNTSCHVSRLDIQYIKDCSCKPKMEHLSMTFRRIVKKCPHEKQITFTYEKNIFQTKEEKIVHLECIYTVLDKKTFRFRLSVTALENSNISGTTTLILDRICCKPGMTLLDFDNKTYFVSLVTIDAYPVFVGDPCKPLQAIWAYNNFNEDIKYLIEPAVSDQLKIFEFPTPAGVIPAYSAHPIIYRFNPYQFRTYTRVFKLFTSQATFTLYMTGEGVIYTCYETYNMLNKVPQYSLFRDYKELVEISMDSCRLAPMLLHSTRKKMVFLENNTKENVEFSWERRRFGAMFNVKVIPEKGILKPGQLAPCQVVIESLSVTSRMTIVLKCMFVLLDSTNAYLSKVEHVRKIGPIYDATFQHNRGDDYVPLKLNLKKAAKTSETYFNLTICVHSLSEKDLDFVLPNVKDQMKNLFQNTMGLDEIAISPLTKMEGDICIDTLTKVMWEVLNRKVFQMSLEKDGGGPTYYKDMAEAERTLPAVSTPNRLVTNVLDKAIFTQLLKMLDVKEDWKDNLASTQQTNDENEKHAIVHINNKYYRDILENCSYDVVSLRNEGNCTFEKRYN